MLHGLVLGSALLALGSDAPAVDLAGYEAAKAAAARDPGALVALALWCEARGLSSRRDENLRLAVEIKPDHPAARRLLGQMNDRGEWRSPERAIAEAKGQVDRADSLARYDLRREQVADTPQAQWQLAQWCEQAGLLGEAEAHLRAVVRLDPSREEAWKKLGARKQGGRWIIPDQLAAEKADAEVRRRADARWRPLLEKWKAWLGQKSRKAEAESALEKLTDPGAVPSIVRVFGAGGPEDQGVAVRLLGQVDAPSASRALAALALFGSTDVVRRSAAETLAGRDPRECSTWLIAWLRDPIKFEVKPVGGPGSPGELYVQGKRLNSRRFYSAPPPLLDFRPGDTLRLDEDGFLVARRMVGYSTQPIAAALDPLYSGAPDMTGLGPKLDHGGMGAAGERLGQHLAQAQKHNSSLIDQVTRVNPGAGGTSFDAPIQADIPYGQMMMLAEQNAALARRRLQQDVATLERYNLEVERLNAMASMALKVASGEAREATRDAWRKWWVELEETSTVAPPRTRAVAPDESRTTGPLGAKARMPSFGKGTPVWILAGVRAIEEIRAGDLVLTQDMASGALGFSPVLTTRRVDPGLARSVRVGEASIVATDLERFWKAGCGWVILGDLKPGDAIRTLGGRSEVVAIAEPKPQPIYHVQVGDRRGIFVGQAGLLVHDDRVNDPVPTPFDAVSDLPASRAGRPD